MSRKKHEKATKLAGMFGTMDVFDSSCSIVFILKFCLYFLLKLVKHDSDR